MLLAAVSVLILVIILVLIVVLVVVLILILIVVLILVLVLVIHRINPPFISFGLPQDSIPNQLGFILCFENQAYQ